MWDQVGISIRTVPGKRVQETQELLERVHRFAPHARVVEHASGMTFAQAYAECFSVHLGSYARWVLQFEDDAILAPDFEDHALPMLQRADQLHDIGLVSFYSGRRVTEELPDPPRLEYLPGARFLMAQAIAIPIDFVRSHNNFVISLLGDKVGGGDWSTSQWLHANRLRFARAWPSIVQHRKNPSLISPHHSQNHPNRYSPSYEARYGSLK